MDVEICLNLRAPSPLCARYREVFSSAEEPLILLMQGPKEEGEADSPFHLIGSYLLDSWEIRQNRPSP